MSEAMFCFVTYTRTYYYDLRTLYYVLQAVAWEGSRYVLQAGGGGCRVGGGKYLYELMYYHGRTVHPCTKVDFHLPAGS